MRSADDKHYLQPVGPEKETSIGDMISRLFRLHDAPKSCNLISILDETNRIAKSLQGQGHAMTAHRHL